MSQTQKLKESLLSKILNLQPSEEQVGAAELLEIGSYYWLWDEESLEDMTTDELTDLINCIED